MKKLLIPAFAAAAFLLGSCSTTQLAQQANNDDVYNSNAQAREVDYAQANDRNYRTDEQLYGGGDYRDTDYDDVDYDYDYGYASRINRFHYNSPWRTYYDSWYTYAYDPWYSYDPFFYGPGMYGGGFSMWFGFGGFQRNMWGYNPWGAYYGYPYYSNYWGPISYYGYPGWGYGGGYYGGRGVVVSNRDYRARPGAGTGNPNYNGGTRTTRPTTATGSGAESVRGRSARPAVDNTGRTSTSGRTGTTPSERPTRTEQPARTERPAQSERPAQQSRPERPARTERPSRSESTQSRPQRSSTPDRSPSVQSSPRPSSSSSGNSGSGSRTSSGGGSSRPSRSGR